LGRALGGGEPKPSEFGFGLGPPPGPVRPALGLLRIEAVMPMKDASMRGTPMRGVTIDELPLRKLSEVLNFSSMGGHAHHVVDR
jgi:hypothetical protein